MEVTEALGTLEGRRVFTEEDVHARGSSIRRGTGGIVQHYAAAFWHAKGQALGLRMGRLSGEKKN